MFTRTTAMSAVITLCLAVVASLPAQEAVEKAYADAHAALSRLAAVAKANGHRTHETLDTILRDLKDIGAILEKDAARRLARKGPQILLEMKLFEPSEEVERLGIDTTGTTDSRNGALLIDAEVAAAVAKAARKSMISAPSVLTYGGETATLNIGTHHTIHWLQLERDGRYAMRKKVVEDRVHIAINPTVKAKGEDRFIDIAADLAISMVVGRTPVEAGAEAIGLPITNTREHASKVRVPDGGHVALMFPGSKDAPVLWLLIHAKTVDGPPDRSR